jgi:transposase
MQDGAPGHAAGETKEELAARGIEVIFWPPFSPDLNPIEKVWHIMKNYLQDNYPENMSYDRLREAVNDAWNKVGEARLRELIGDMEDRCKAVINANGKFTKY